MKGLELGLSRGTALLMASSRFDRMLVSIFSVLKGYILVFVALITGAMNAYAEMQPLDDEALSDISGQAYVTIDTESQGGKDLTRINLGMEISTQLNVDEFKLGEYHRWENGAPCPECDGTEEGLEQQGADIWVKNMSFGAIAETSGVKMDGKYYRAGEIIPFQFFDPYLELAKEDGEIVGFRIGVHKARGLFSGDIQSFTGQLPVQIKDRASALLQAPNRPWWMAAAGVLLPFTPVEGLAQPITAPDIVDGEIDYTTGGQLDPVRATHIGLPSGNAFTLGPLPLIGDIDFNTTDCNLYGIPTCFPMSQFKSLEVGEKQSDGSYDPVGGFFLSMQKQSMTWVDPVSHQEVQTPAGFFYSVPVGSIELNLDQSFNGTPQRRVEYINRGNNLF